MSIYYDNRSHKWCMDIRIGVKRLQVHNREQQPLLRMETIIRNNHLPYDRAKRLAVDFNADKIPAGYIGHKYLCPDTGYRLLIAYTNGDGFISKYYPTAAEAWQDPRIQSRIATTGVQYADYDTYIRTVDSGKPWTLMGLAILHCRITVRGNLRIVKKPLE